MFDLRKYILPAILVFLHDSPVAVLAQVDLIPADRKINWSGYVGVPGGIPKRTTICQTLGAPGKLPIDVQSVTASQINGAVGACKNKDQVVFLNQGTYNIGGINLATSNRVTLRGAGPGKTIINSTSGSASITTDQYSIAAGATAILSGYSKDSTSITVASSAGFTVGNIIKLDQADDTSFVMSSNGPGRHVAFLSMITGCGTTTTGDTCTSNTITFSTPLPYGFSANLSPKAYYMLGGPGISWTGVEDMSIKNNGGAADIIAYWSAYACWIKNVEMSNGENTFAFFVDTFRSEMRDSYAHHAVNAPNNSDGFGIYLYNAATYNLVENNTFDTLFVGPFQTAASANAFSYNFNHNGVAQGFPHQLGVMNSNHGAHSMMTLWEGNVGNQWQNDGYHGSGSHQVLFRNLVDGIHPTFTTNRKMLDLTRGSYFHTVVGNVLGAASWAASSNPISRFEMTGEPGYDEQQVIYRLGYPNVANNGFDSANPWPYPLTYPDPKVKATLFRWGNFDYFHNSTQWNAADIPQGVPVPNSQILPASLLYNSKPSWFGNLLWPPIGPDVNQLATLIPAQYCFGQGKMPNCLEGTGPGTPSAPNNLRVS